MKNALRWMMFLPLAFVGSLLGGKFMEWTANYLSVWTWGVTSLSGMGSALGFFIVAFRVVPRVALAVKWASVAIVGVLGAISVVGTSIAERPFTDALAGAWMVAASIYVATLPVVALQEINALQGRPTVT